MLKEMFEHLIDLAHINGGLVILPSQFVFPHLVSLIHIQANILMEYVNINERHCDKFLAYSYLDITTSISTTQNAKENVRKNATMVKNS